MAILDLLAFLLHILNSVIVPIIFAISFLVFIWGVFKYFIQEGESSDSQKKGRMFILSGLIGFFLMISVWGLVNVLVNTFGFDQVNRPPLPYFNGASFGGFR